jgi:hypothetical protein
VSESVEGDFLGEIGLDIAVVSFLLFFRYKGANKWKIGSFVFMLFITPLYLHWFSVPVLWLIGEWCLLLPFGFFFG